MTRTEQIYVPGKKTERKYQKLGFNTVRVKVMKQQTKPALCNISSLNPERQLRSVSLS